MLTYLTALRAASTGGLAKAYSMQAEVDSVRYARTIYSIGPTFLGELFLGSAKGRHESYVLTDWRSQLAWLRKLSERARAQYSRL